MKRTLLTVLALALVAGLLIAVFAMTALRRASPSAGPATASGPGVAKGGRPAPGSGAADGATLAADAEIRVGDAWRALRSDDLKSLAANLRAAGFPPEVIRAVVGAMLHEQFAARRRQIIGDQPAPPYWQAGSMASFYSSPQMAALRQLAREEQETLRQLLGPDSASSEVTQLYHQRMFGNLPPEKADALQRILADYSDLRSQALADWSYGGTMLPSDRQKLALLDKEQRDDIAALLTPDELQQYDLRSSPTAQRLRSRLAYFNPTEQEFLALYSLQGPFDQQYNGPANLMGMMSPDLMQQRQAAQQQLNDQIKAALGDARYAEYQQDTNPGYQVAARLASNLQLPAENAAATWTLQQNTQAQATALRANRELTGAQRAEALQALAAQADQQLTTLLTPAGADAYKQTSGGMWLRALETSSRRQAGATSPAPPAAASPHN